MNTVPEDYYEHPIALPSKGHLILNLRFLVEYPKGTSRSVDKESKTEERYNLNLSKDTSNLAVAKDV